MEVTAFMERGVELRPCRVGVGGWRVGQKNICRGLKDNQPSVGEEGKGEGRTRREKRATGRQSHLCKPPFAPFPRPTGGSGICRRSSGKLSGCPWLLNGGRAGYTWGGETGTSSALRICLYLSIKKRKIKTTELCRAH